MSDYRRLVVISRANYVKRNGVLYFQDNDGYYIDQIAGLFDEVLVCAREYQSDVSSPKYGYQFQSKNIQVNDTMRQVSIWDVKDVTRLMGEFLECIYGADVAYGYINSIRGCLFTLVASYRPQSRLIVYNGTDLSRSLKVRNVGHLKRWFTLKLESLTMKRATARMVTGPYLEKKFKSLGSVVMTTPVSRILRCEPPQPRKIFHGDRAAFLCTATLNKYKHVDVLIRALKVVIDSGHEAELHIAGDGPERGSLTQLVKQLGIEEYVIFHGYISDDETLTSLFLKADGVVLASDFEGFPRVVWESLFFGAYVITTRVGGVEYLFNGQYLKVVDENTPECFSEAMIQAITKPGESTSNAQGAQAEFSKLFDKSLREQFQLCLEAD